ncbi:Transposable element Tc1 transposase [Anabarilius grahami]|uniref:Transposable element Tc1 transposase n=1 Tax=Anabarilius grahami TaxID=495550 RepID=A0A3N0YYZ1_ANAGA|nr:Transposable element Tc1 transposase [Anabarilius grahami]
MGKRKDLSEFDKGQIVMARRLGQSISKTISCGVFLVCSGQYLSKVVQGRNSGEPATRRATVAQIAQEVNAGSDRKVSEYTVHRSLLRIGLHSHRPVRVPMLTPVHRRKRQQWAREHPNWTTEQWKKVAWSDESRFLLHHLDGRSTTTSLRC